ncbi:MAG: hypothetical protein ABW133_13315, partial [Polyangiaceae bacterium]
MRKAAIAVSLLFTACLHTRVDVGDDAGAPPGGDAAIAGYRFMGNESNCPASLPQTGDECSVREAQSCAYWWKAGTSGSYQGCTC